MRPITAMVRNPMITRSASAPGSRLSETMIHLLVGIARSSTRIITAINQFATTRARRPAYAIGNAAEDDTDADIHLSLEYRRPKRAVSNINKYVIGSQ